MIVLVVSADNCCYVSSNINNFKMCVLAAEDNFTRNPIKAEHSRRSCVGQLVKHVIKYVTHK